MSQSGEAGGIRERALALVEGLNPEQREAAIHDKGSLLVIAGAGSGKTKTLTARIGWLAGTERARKEEILAVTFTNKAAREMLERIHTATGLETKGMWVGTFHGLCNRMLRRFPKESGLPSSFLILDTGDTLSLLKRVYKANEWSEEAVPPKEALAEIMKWKEKGMRPKDVSARPNSQQEAFKMVFAAYEEQRVRENAVDFPELMLRTVEMLKESEVVRAWAHRQFKQVLVDEFQDTNPIQYEWVRLVTAPEVPVFAVGDDDQSIYAFRGAKIENIRKFADEYKVERIVRLEQNYRSVGNVLEAANKLIANNSGRLGKNLWTSQGTGEKLTMLQVETDLDEARRAVEYAKEAMDAGSPLSEVAFLYRTNAQSRVLEHALIQAGLPYRVHGGLRFFERAEIKSAMAYLRLANNPDDDGAFLRVVNLPVRGIGAKTLEKLTIEARASNRSLWRVACEGKEGGKAGAGLAQFRDVVERLGELAERGTLAELAKAMLKVTEIKKSFEGEKDAEDREQNLEELINAMAQFEQDPQAADISLDAFLAHAALESGSAGAEEGADAVQLMTAHASKGLEFDHVHIVGLEEGLFPHGNAVSDPNPNALEEERRLMYVAITRARKRLTLSRAESRMTHGRTQENAPSRFIDEIPPELMRTVGTITRRAARSESEWEAPSWGGSRGGARSGGGSRSGGSGGSWGGGSKWGGAAEREERRSKFGDRDTEPKADSHAPASWQQGQGDFAPGKRVSHAKFGEGTVAQTSGTGDGLTIEVRFDTAGVKKMLAAVAKLEPVKAKGPKP